MAKKKNINLIMILVVIAIVILLFLPAATNNLESEIEKKEQEISEGTTAASTSPSSTQQDSGEPLVTGVSAIKIHYYDETMTEITAPFDTNWLLRIFYIIEGEQFNPTYFSVEAGFKNTGEIVLNADVYDASPSGLLDAFQNTEPKQVQVEQIVSWNSDLLNIGDYVGTQVYEVWIRGTTDETTSREIIASGSKELTIEADAPPACTSDWSCGSWGECTEVLPSIWRESRTCVDLNGCEPDDIQEQTCTPDLCGDNVINQDDVCDGTDLGGEDCTTIGNYIGGTLECLPDCSGYITSGCTLPQLVQFRTSNTNYRDGDTSIAIGSSCDGSNLLEMGRIGTLGSNAVDCLTYMDAIITMNVPCNKIHCHFGIKNGEYGVCVEREVLPDGLDVWKFSASAYDPVGDDSVSNSPLVETPSLEVEC